ncbi:MAG: hypothetical protein ACJASX_002742 [Limisphaerales bacterium]|jgi:hypothetical protein
MHPEGMPARVIVDSRLLQEFDEFFTEAFHSMMFLLVRDILLHAFSRGGTDGERAVAFLPREVRPAYFIVSPNGTGLLQFPHEIREAMGGFQAYQKMNMIGDSANPLRFTTETVDRAAQVFVKLRHPTRGDDWLAIFCGKDQVGMKA